MGRVVYISGKMGRWVGKYKDEKMLKPRYVYGKTEAEARQEIA